MLCDHSGISEVGAKGEGRSEGGGLKVGKAASRVPMMCERHGRPKRAWGRKDGVERLCRKNHR